MKFHDLSIKLFADGADKAHILDLNAKPYIKGLTTNPSLMKKAGIKDYEAFARDILETVTEKPISFEVVADTFPEMERQARTIAGWGSNVYVKIPVTNSKGEPSTPLIRTLSRDGVKLNVTALLTAAQAMCVAHSLNPAVPSIVSVFAGRIADTGLDPVWMMRECKAALASCRSAELLWASTREALNIFQAESCGADIITAPPDILDKAMKFGGMGLNELSLETVKMFLRDATQAGFTI
jgi:transaldolase